MLAAYVVLLRVAQPLTVQNHLGRAVQQICLDRVRQVDPALSETIHATAQTKPYAVSGLLRPDGGPVWGRVARDDPAWVRLVALRADVVAALDEFARQPPATLDIDRAAWEIERVIMAADHPWAGRATYADLIAAHQSAPPPSQITLDFASPTGFHSNGLNRPLPEPPLVFGSLLRQWNDLSGFPLPDVLTPFFAWRVMLSRCRIETHLLHFKQGSKQVGFTGQAVFGLATRNVQLERTDPALADALTASHDDCARALGLLAAFAFYSGVGIKTTTGMGLARAI